MRHGKHRARLNLIVFILAFALIGFCVLKSVEDKGGLPADASDVADLVDGIAEEVVALDFSGIWDSIAGFLDRLLDGGAASEPDSSQPVQGSGSLAEVHFIDVGQGKSILILSGGDAALIDVGDNGRGADVIGYLRERKVSELDVLIGTHPHSDHIGDMDRIIEEFKIGSVILPDLPEEIVPTTLTYTDLLMAIGKAGLKIDIARPGAEYKLGDAVLTILGPVAEYDDLNNNSIVCRLDFGKTSFLFTGDIEAKAESGLLERKANLSADVLDIAHHGSLSSSTAAFIKAVSPEIAVASAGLDNGYGHPSREVMERIAAQGAAIFRTDLDGAVVITSDGANLEVHTEK